MKKKIFFLILFLNSSITIFSQNITEFYTDISFINEIATDNNNVVYFTSSDAGKIYTLDETGKANEIVATGFKISGIAFNKKNELFIVDPINRKILKQDTTGELTTYKVLVDDEPSGVNFYNNELYYSSKNNSKIVKIKADLTTEDIATGFSKPTSFSFDPKGNLYVVDSQEAKVFLIKTDGTKTAIAGIIGDNTKEIISNVTVLNDDAYYTIYNKQYNTSRVARYDFESGYTSYPLDSSLNIPKGLSFDSLGNLYVANENGKIVKARSYSFIDKNTVINIPDVNFKNYLLSVPEINSNDDNEIQLTEAYSCQVPIKIQNIEVKSLEGIEHFEYITKIYCYFNKLEALDVSKNKRLKELYVSGNQLKTLILNEGTLQNLECGGNQLTNIDVSKNPNLKELACESNLLTSIDISKNPLLKDFTCGNNKLKKLDISNNPLITQLLCDNNELEELIPNNTLEILQSDKNNLTSLDLSKIETLTDLKCENNNLKTLKIGSNVRSLFCHDNQLDSLDISKNKDITYLPCYNNKLTYLKLNNNLNEVKANNNLLKKVTLPESVKRLDFTNNQLETLDLSRNTNLVVVELNNNNLKSLNVGNNNNDELTFLYTKNNPNLSCVKIDEGFVPTSEFWKKDDGTTYSSDCITEDINDKDFSKEVDVYPNPVVSQLKIKTNDTTMIKSIKVFNLLGEEIINTTNKIIDISRFSKGMYVIKIKNTSNKTAIKKLIKS